MIEFFTDVKLDGTGSIVPYSTYPPNFSYMAPDIGGFTIGSASKICQEDMQNMNASLSNFTLINIAVDNSAGSWPATTLTESRFFDAYVYTPECGSEPTDRKVYYKQEWDNTKTYADIDLTFFTEITAG